MARNDEIKKKNREITVCGFPSIYSKYFFQTNTKIFYKSLKSFITCFWPEITYWRFMTCSIPQCKFFIKDHILKVHNLLNLTMHELMEHNMWTCWKHQVPAYSKVKVHEHRMVSSVQLNHDFFCIIFMAPSLASLSAASFPSTPLWPGTCFCQMKKIVNPYTDRQA